MRSLRMLHASSKLCLPVYSERGKQAGCLLADFLAISLSMWQIQRAHTGWLRSMWVTQGLYESDQRQTRQVSTMTALPWLQRRLEYGCSLEDYEENGRESTVTEHSLCSVTLDNSLKFFHTFQDPIYHILRSRTTPPVKPNSFCAVQNGSQGPHAAI